MLFRSSEEQLDPFDSEFRDWPAYRDLLDKVLSPTDDATVLDVGGGNGRFLDAVLTNFPNCVGVLVDNSDYMLSKNISHVRKRLVHASALDVDGSIAAGSCNVITFNVILHHLVGRTYQSAMDSVVKALTNAARLLAPGGRIVVYEQVYDGLVPGVEPGAIIFAVTRIRIPAFVRVARRFGANTAGVGVYFRSRNSWMRVFRAAGLQLVEQRPVYQDSPPAFRKACFLIRQVGTHIFVLAK